ncbi:MAG: acetylxylan esterase [Clostridiales bacterium]|nr:acetylxylan esterase [Clostridiales bacterium]
MLESLLASRALPDILKMDDGREVTPALWPERRRELLRKLETYSYGITPPAAKVTAEIVSEDPHAYAWKVMQRRVNLTFDTPGGPFTFPLIVFIPYTQTPPPVLLQIAFRREIPDRYAPVEEITDRGYAYVQFCYQDVVNDRLFGDFSDGLALKYGTDCARKPDAWGKIGMWAYAASRALDYLLTCPELDAKHTAVLGHSRLGKTALWAGAQDERFWCTVSNCSGYGGAATSKHGEGERVVDFLRAGSWDWYCENFKAYTGSLEDEKPYDQSWLLALVAPRLLCVGSAVMDRGADPTSEFLTTLAASGAWELLGVPGLVTPDRLPVPGDTLDEGRVHYHLRPHHHFFSREDWGYYMTFLDSKLRS